MMKRILMIIAALSLLLMSACSQQPAKEVNLTEVMDALAGTYGLEEGMLTLTEDDLLELYGIQSADVKQFAARMKLDSIQADEVILIEAVDRQAAGRVKEKLDARYQSKLNETRDYLPDEYAKIEKCKVTENGNFVSLIICEGAEAAQTDYEKALK